MNQRANCGGQARPLPVLSDVSNLSPCSKTAYAIDSDQNHTFLHIGMAIAIKILVPWSLGGDLCIGETAAAEGFPCAEKRSLDPCP